MRNIIFIGLSLLFLLFYSEGFSQKLDAELGETKNEEVYTIVEKMPEFSGGKEGLLNYLRKNLVYPEKSKREKVEGKVIVNFTINKKGKTTDIKIIQSVCKEIDESAIKLVKNMPKWKPGTQDGIPVLVSFNLPLVFALPKED